MSIGMSDLLMLAGRLDDSPGFDTPRERLRRFLTERITQPGLATSILDECQRTIGEQPHRVLQDTVVLLGRFLGFEATFGTYQRIAGAVKFDGEWRSPGRMHAVLEVRSDQMRMTDFESLERSLAAVTAAASLESETPLGLCILARQYAGRVKLENLLTSGHSHMRVVSVRSLTWLAEAVAAGHLRHEDILKLLRSGTDLDFVVELLDRVSAPSRPIAEVARDAPLPMSMAQPEERFWATTITGSDSAAPEQLLTAVIGQRHILGVTYPGPHGGAAPGDWVALLMPSKGVVGHAQLASVIDRTAGVVRHSERFSRVFGLDNLELYEEPIAPPAEMEHMVSGGSEVPLAGPHLVGISREDFIALTKWRDPSSLPLEPVLEPGSVDALLT
jgi:hypothetical protein